MSGQDNYKVQNMKTKEYQLAELIEVTRGTSLKGEYYSTSGKYKRMTLGNFDYNNNAFKEDKQKDNIYYIGNFDEKFILNEGDIVTPLTEQTIGLLGSTAFIPQSDVYIHSQDIGLIIPNKNIDKNFCYYLISSDFVKKQISSMAQQTKIRHTSPNKIKQCKVIIPDDLKYQKIVGEILRKIDIKIDLNNNMILILESMMKDIYDYWFVQFDFPNEKGKPYKSSGGKMVYNEKLKREIPQNFKYADIGNIEKNIITGKTPPTINVENYNGEIPFITISDIRNNIFVYETEQTLSELGANTQNNKFLPIGSLCVSCIASIGEIGFTTKISQTNQQINSIVFENEYNKEFFYFALKDYFRKSYVVKTGNTFKNMNKHDFSQIKILYSEELVKCFHNAVKAYMDKVRVLYKQNSKLKHYKNFILPLLMNGQVEVK